HLRRTLGVIVDLHVVPGHAFGQSGAQRLEDGLLGCITLGQIARRLRVGKIALHLVGGQDAPGEALALTPQYRLDTTDQHHIGAYTDDHRGASAPMISARISATAPARPENSARAMIAWPMLSSLIPGIAAMGSTL